MDNSFLNSINREYYVKALKFLKDSGNDVWKLDDQVEEHIDRINCNGKVHTMYSKRGRRLGDHNSYLTICYIREVEGKIRQVIAPKLNTAFENNHFRKFEIEFRPPRIVPATEGADPCLKYIDDPNYWNIHNVKFELKGGHSQDHETFWTILPDELSNL